MRAPATRNTPSQRTAHSLTQHHSFIIHSFIRISITNIKILLLLHSSKKSILIACDDPTDHKTKKIRYKKIRNHEIPPIIYV
jgi:hypothetical protein